MGAFLITFEPFILTVHFIVALFLITVILLQAGKGTDIGAMFGAGSSQSLFGARGAATFLSKITTVSAMLFLLTSLSLATIANYAASGGGDSVIGDESGLTAPPADDSAPADGTADPLTDPASAP